MTISREELAALLANVPPEPEYRPNPKYQRAVGWVRIEEARDPKTKGNSATYSIVRDVEKNLFVLTRHLHAGVGPVTLARLKDMSLAEKVMRLCVRYDSKITWLLQEKGEASEDFTGFLMGVFQEARNG